MKRSTGIGKSVPQISVGASVAAGGAGALFFRTAVCYAAEKGMTCGTPLTIPVALATFLLLSGGWTVKIGLQNMTQGKIGDRTASTVQAMDNLGQLLGKGKTQKMAGDLQEAYRASTDLYNSASNGIANLYSWWYGTPAQPAAAPPVKTD